MIKLFVKAQTLFRQVWQTQATEHCNISPSDADWLSSDGFDLLCTTGVVDFKTITQVSNGIPETVIGPGMSNSAKNLAETMGLTDEIYSDPYHWLPMYRWDTVTELWSNWGSGGGFFAGAFRSIGNMFHSVIEIFYIIASVTWYLIGVLVKISTDGPAFIDEFINRVNGYWVYFTSAGITSGLYGIIMLWALIHAFRLYLKEGPSPAVKSFLRSAVPLGIVVSMAIFASGTAPTGDVITSHRPARTVVVGTGGIGGVGESIRLREATTTTRAVYKPIGDQAVGTPKWLLHRILELGAFISEPIMSYGSNIGKVGVTSPVTTCDAFIATLEQLYLRAWDIRNEDTKKTTFNYNATRASPLLMSRVWQQSYWTTFGIAQYGDPQAARRGGCMLGEWHNDGVTPLETMAVWSSSCGFDPDESKGVSHYRLFGCDYFTGAAGTGSVENANPIKNATWGLAPTPYADKKKHTANLGHLSAYAGAVFEPDHGNINDRVREETYALNAWGFCDYLTIPLSGIGQRTPKSYLSKVGELQADARASGLPPPIYAYPLAGEPISLIEDNGEGKWSGYTVKTDNVLTDGGGNGVNYFSAITHPNLGGANTTSLDARAIGLTMGKYTSTVGACASIFFGNAEKNLPHQNLRFGITTLADGTQWEDSSLLGPQAYDGGSYDVPGFANKMGSGRMAFETGKVGHKIRSTVSSPVKEDNGTITIDTGHINRNFAGQGLGIVDSVNGRRIPQSVILALATAVTAVLMFLTLAGLAVGAALSHLILAIVIGTLPVTLMIAAIPLESTRTLAKKIMKIIVGVMLARTFYAIVLALLIMMMSIVNEVLAPVFDQGSLMHVMFIGVNGILALKLVQALCKFMKLDIKGFKKAIAVGSGLQFANFGEVITKERHPINKAGKWIGEKLPDEKAADPLGGNRGARLSPRKWIGGKAGGAGGGAGFRNFRAGSGGGAGKPGGTSGFSGFHAGSGGGAPIPGGTSGFGNPFKGGFGGNSGFPRSGGAWRRSGGTRPRNSGNNSDGQSTSDDSNEYGDEDTPYAEHSTRGKPRWLRRKAKDGFQKLSSRRRYDPEVRKEVSSSQRRLHTSWSIAGTGAAVAAGALGLGVPIVAGAVGGFALPWASRMLRNKGRKLIGRGKLPTRKKQMLDIMEKRLEKANNEKQEFDEAQERLQTAQERVQTEQTNRETAAEREVQDAAKERERAEAKKREEKAKEAKEARIQATRAREHGETSNLLKSILDSIQKGGGSGEGHSDRGEQTSPGSSQRGQEQPTRDSTQGNRDQAQDRREEAQNRLDREQREREREQHRQAQERAEQERRNRENTDS